MQMNFRGSTGYGRKFWESGFKEWGSKMQDDITDGVHWLIQQGLADPERVAVYGASYGGSTVLEGVVETPGCLCRPLLLKKKKNLDRMLAVSICVHLRHLRIDFRSEEHTP